MAIPKSGPDDLPWHENVDKREQVGRSAEDEFGFFWRCHCGGEFIRHDKKPGVPDYSCDECDQIVEIKSAPDAEKYGAITISQIPFNRYSPGVLIAWRPEPGRWMGAYRRDLEAMGPARKPTHGKRATWFYRVSIAPFEELEKLGFHKR